MRKITGISIVTLALCASNAFSQVFLETEPNDSKAAANIVNCMRAAPDPGEFSAIQGASTSSSGAGLDYFDVRICPAPLGIYRHRLVITSPTVGHTGTIRGLSQTGAPADTMAGIPWDGVVGTPIAGGDTAAQTTSTTTSPPRFNQWYGFGLAERLYYRVTGTSSTTAAYTATLETVSIVPTFMGRGIPPTPTCGCTTAVSTRLSATGTTTQAPPWAAPPSGPRRSSRGSPDLMPRVITTSP
jgi:hypothetical protein